MDILSQLVYTLGIAVATHEGDASDVFTILIGKGINGIRIQRQSDIFPKIMTMTPRTVTRAIRNINCQCHTSLGIS